MIIMVLLDLGTPDPTTIASIINPSIIKFEPCKVEIVSDGDNKGECHVTLTDKSNIMVSTSFDLEKFRKVFKDTFN